MKHPEEPFPALRCTTLLVLVTVMAAALAACLDRPAIQACDDGLCPMGWYCVAPGECQPSECGNAILDPGEECDCGEGGTTPQSASCRGEANSALGGYCRLDCRLHCGDGEIASEEVCDPGVSVTQSCTSFRYDFGHLACSNSCDAFITADCGVWGWQPMDTPTGADLNGVWGSGPGDVYAVGGDLGTNEGTVLHYDGQSWEAMDPPTDALLFGVWGSGPGDVYAVGEEGTVLHYDGQSWEAMDPPTGAWLCGVWGSGPGDVYAVGEGGTVLHYDGQSWARMRSGTTNSLLAAWGPSAQETFFVGANGSIYHRLIHGCTLLIGHVCELLAQHVALLIRE